MSKPVDSFFDDGKEGYSLWQSPSGSYSISQADIIFQAPLLKISTKTNKFKERYFVLTNDYLFHLKSEVAPKILAIMPLQYVRVDYLSNKPFDGKESNFCFRFVRNMRYTDLYTDDESHFEEWRKHFCKVLIQCDFHTKFTTIKMIGKGSFARVYLVENKETKEKFAVKAFSKEYLLSQAKGKESLVNEIEIMQKLKHPYIMNLEEIHESKNSIYLVLELLEGGELLNYLSSKETLTFKDHCRVMKCILEALAYMNEKKIMHRDLKPDNMILKERNKLESCTLKIVDFGLATIYDIPEYLFKRCGTPGFVAPEVINAPSNENIHYTPKCDIFSAGVIFYILLTDKSPFDGKSFKEILQKNKACKIDYNHALLKKNPVALNLLIKMTETDPQKRISAQDALQHPFFVQVDDNSMIIEKDSVQANQKISRYSTDNPRISKITQNGMIDANSLVIREAIITGNTYTVQDSLNSHGVISSFKSMSSPKKIDNFKRESILKIVLIQNAQQGSASIYGPNFVHEIYDSDNDDGSFEYN